MKTFQLFDAGVNARPKGGDKGDCTVRALAVARGMTYQESWALLYRVQGEMAWCHFPLVQALRAKDPRFDVIRQIDFPAERGRARMSGRVFAEKHRRGRFVLLMANHVAAVKFGVVYDIFNSTSKCVYTAWEIEPFDPFANEGSAGEGSVT